MFFLFCWTSQGTLNNPAQECGTPRGLGRGSVPSVYEDPTTASEGIAPPNIKFYFC